MTPNCKYEVKISLQTYAVVSPIDEVNDGDLHKRALPVRDFHSNLVHFTFLATAPERGLKNHRKS